MSQKMRALFYDGSPEIQLGSFPIPVPQDNQSLLRVLRAGICGTDLSILSGKHPRAKPGLIPGHELAAEVVEIRGEAVNFHPGDRVSLEPIISCGTCVACRSGVPHVCQNLQLYGIDLPGGMAEFMVADNKKIVPAAEGMPPELVVLTEPLAIAVHATRIGAPKFRDRLCVIGGGPIGILVGILAQRVSGRQIIISEPNKKRQKQAESLGFDVVDPSSQPLEEYISAVSGGRGMDMVFECAGSQPAILSSTKILRPRGTLVQVSIPKDIRNFNMVDLTFKELIVRGVRVYEPFDFEYAMEFLRSESRLFDIFKSEAFTLSSAREAFAAAGTGEEGLRVIFDLEKKE